MEFPNVVTNCAQSSCNQLDFLPLRCECGQVFCSEHFSIHTESCKPSKTVSQNELKTIRDLFVCSHLSCNDRSIVPLICERCKRHFCVKHRHLIECEEKSPVLLAKERERYAEPAQRFGEAKALVDKQVG